MFAVQTLIVAALLTQLVLVVESGINGNPPGGRISEDLSLDLYKATVTHAKKFTRPLDGYDEEHGIVCHSGLVVTLEGLDTKLLIHKVDIGMLVEDAAKMGPEWTSDSPMGGKEKDSVKGRTVADLVKIGGPYYNVVFSNCHHAVNKMLKKLKRTMKQK
ncbi:unnamed protein product [Gadus morhua 'NCC']